MKKFLVFVAIILIVVLAFIHFLLPNTMDAQGVIVINATPNSTQRFTSEPEKIKKWWPGTVLSDSQFVFEEDTFFFRRGYFMGTISLIKTKDSVLTTMINILPVQIDSTVLNWNANISSGNGLFERIQLYNNQKKLEKKLQKLADQLKVFLSKVENAYGMNISEERVVDTLLIATRKNFKSYPSTSEVNEMIQSLRDFIISKNAQPTNPPMLHVSQKADGDYEAMTAIPVNKEIDTGDKFEIKRMVRGKILVGEVKGGPHTILEAEKHMENYVLDYRRASPAISYQSIVTDRKSESDSSQWITRIYYPVL